jgi:hypothetical protein
MAELEHPNVVGNFLSNYYGAQQQQQASDDRRMQQQRLERADKLEQMQLEFNQAQQRADKIARAAYALDTPEKWNAAVPQIMQELGVQGPPPDFSQRERILSETLSVKDQLDMEMTRRGMQLKERVANAQAASEYAQAAAANSLAAQRANIGGQPGMKAPSGYRYSQNQAGEYALEPIPGGPADPAQKPLTDDQSKAVGFASRLRDADARLSSQEVQNALQSGYDNTVAGIPLGIGNSLVTNEYQIGDQARRDFLNSQLRRESGAVIGNQEFLSGAKQYFPEYGDKPDVLLNKAASRKQAIYNMLVSAGPKYAQEAAKAKKEYEDTLASINKARKAAAPGAVIKYDAAGNRIP